MTVSGEFGWIETYLAPLAHLKGAAGLKDDVASLPSSKTGWIVNTDTLVESVHFHPGTDAAKLARKTLRVNLSDIAGKGAVPYGYFLNLTLPKNCDAAWMASFAEGLQLDQTEFGLGLLGGDISRTPGPITLSATLMAKAPEKRLLRSGGQPGDNVYVTGTIGDAYLGLIKPSHNSFVNAYELPSPRLDVRGILMDYATASLDVSDGLLADGLHLARASEVCVTIETEHVPFSSEAQTFMRQGRVSDMDLLAGGDDYEVLFTAPAAAHEHITNAARSLSFGLHHIGSLSKGEGMKLTKRGQPVDMPNTLGYTHF